MRPSLCELACAFDVVHENRIGRLCTCMGWTSAVGACPATTPSRVGYSGCGSKKRYFCTVCGFKSWHLFSGCGVDRYNLRYSCVLEMLEFIRKENIKSLVQHLAEVHRADLEAMTYVSTPADLLTRHEQNTEILNMEQNYQPPAGVAGAREVGLRPRTTVGVDGRE